MVKTLLACTTRQTSWPATIWGGAWLVAPSWAMRARGWAREAKWELKDRISLALVLFLCYTL